MREKKRCRWLALLLAVVMLLSVLPTAVFAEGDSDNTFYRIFHLDCGRKYFTVAQVKALIDTLAANHYTHIELAVGNDGLRFLLDDMSVTANDTTYTSDAVKAGIQAGNKAYYNAGTYNELTQTEMDTIISYANEKGIGIIPLINTPGHMDAILDCMESVGISNPAYSNSARTVDVTNTAAVNFTLALVNKYIQYFAGKGCTIFNMGCDEYANDVSNSGFAGLISSGKYGDFITYVNNMAAQVKAAGMIPMAFNDGIYYNSNTSSGTFDTNIVIAYWTSGWNDYSPASASFLAQKGHKIISTNDAWYYVLGRQAGNSSGYTIATAQNGVQNTACTDIPGDNDPTAAGCMICLWCDTPRASYSSTEVSNVTGLLTTFSASNPTYFVADSGETDPTDPGEVTNYETITVSVGQTATATISGANYAGTYTTEDPTVATVEVTGEDATEATTTYTEASVTCNTLISRDSNSWTAASGYYYTPDGTNYYPVYAKRSSTTKGNLWKYTEYTYTWGYKVDDSEPIQIGNAQVEVDRFNDGRYETPGITVYTQGTVAGTPASTTVTFTGVAVGTTYVTVGNTRYTINVVDKAPDGALTGSTLTIVYRITNSTVYTSQNTSSAASVTISSSDAASEAGIAVVAKVPETAYSNYDDWIELHYWQAMRLDAEHNQSGSGSGADQTGEGTTFTHVRYYNSAWQYMTSDGVWHYFLSGDQAVAYYMRHTEITTEITTAMKDWGYSTDSTTPDTSSNQGQVALTVAVVYPDGTVSPAESNMYAQSTTIFNFSTNWQSSGKARDIGLIVPLNNSDYTISKITVTDGTRTDNTNSNTWASSATISWDKVQNEEAGSEWYDETIYWQESDGGTPMINGATQNIRWSAKNTAKLVLIYLKPIHYDTNLIVNWVDDSTSGALISTMEVAVSSDGTPITFYNGLKQTSALPTEGVGGTFTLDDSAYVTNSSNVNQTFNKNISTVPDVADKYKTGLYQYVSADLSADGMTLTLHYNIDSSKLKHNYVLDFGLPVFVPLSDLIENPVDVTGITTESNKITFDDAKDALIYTPSEVMNGTDLISVTLHGVDAKFQIGFTPASNVLYEDDFLTVDEEKSGTNKWVKANATVSPQQSANQSTLYGYDDAYKTSTGNSMGSAWTITGLSSGNGSKYLTTTFTGNGFDLIGTCGPDTGYVYLLLQGAENKLVVIDTSYVGGGTLYQVPLAHEMLTNGTYTAYIRAAYRKGTTTAGSGDAGTQMSRAAAFSMSAAPTALDSVYDMVDELFADGFEIDDVEYVYFDDASALAELENSSRATYAMSYALNSASAAATEEAEVNATGRPAGTTVTIDGFRVYRGTNDAYIVSEQNREYVNVLDKVTDGFAAYVEGNANGTGYEKGTYESQGGPQNEIYLVAGKDAVTFQTKLTEGDTVQVSARAVSGTAYLNGKAIQSQTEMYYTVTVGTDGVITIGNMPPEGTTAAGMLAIANLKVPANTTFETPTEQTFVTAFAMMRSYSAAPTEPDPEQPGTEEPAPTPVFTPETFKTRVNSIRTRSKKIVTLTITASTDVDHVVVNGKTYYPMNKLLVKWGLSKTYVFTIMDTAGASETRSFEIVAYNADGLASSTYTDAG